VQKAMRKEFMITYPVCSFQLAKERGCSVACNSSCEGIYDNQGGEKSSAIVRIKYTN